MSKTISISILDTNLLKLDTTFSLLQHHNITHIHLDILDTSFVPNISFGPSIINRILEYNFIFDIHFMVKNPIPILKLLEIKNEETRIVYHYEIEEEIKNKIERMGIKTGIALNPESQPEIEHEFVLVMGVKPGFGNQKFIVECADKLRKYPGSRLGVDGGINLDTVKYVKSADHFVVGSAFFNAEDKELFLRRFMEEVSD